MFRAAHSLKGRRERGTRPPRDHLPSPRTLALHHARETGSVEPGHMQALFAELDGVKAAPPACVSTRARDTASAAAPASHCAAAARRRSSGTGAAKAARSQSLLLSPSIPCSSDAADRPAQVLRDQREPRAARVESRAARVATHKLDPCSPAAATWWSRATLWRRARAIRGLRETGHAYRAGGAPGRRARRRPLHDLATPSVARARARRGRRRPSPRGRKP